MTAPTDADVERVLAEARWLARGGSAPAANKRVAAALIEAHAENHRLREALEEIRQEVVVAIAFLGRDAGSERLPGTASGLISRLVKADAKASAALGAKP